MHVYSSALGLRASRPAGSLVCFSTPYFVEQYIEQKWLRHDVRYFVNLLGDQERSSSLHKNYTRDTAAGGCQENGIIGKGETRLASEPPVCNWTFRLFPAQNIWAFSGG